MNKPPFGALALFFLLVLPPSLAQADFASGIKAYDAEDDAVALRELLPLADAGNAEVQYKIGIIYDRNKGVPRNAVKAIAYFKRAASAGYVKAQYNLGVIFIEEKGSEKSVENGLIRLVRSANSGYLPAMFNLGAYHDIGEFVPVDYQAALYWYKRAAEKNHASAQFNLGILYITGRGVKRDYIEGFKWLFIAEENGETGTPNAVRRFSKFTGSEFIELGKAEMLRWKKARAPKQ